MIALRRMLAFWSVFVCCAVWVAPALATTSPATISTSFGTTSLSLGSTTSLSFAIGNPNLDTGLTNVGFTDKLPRGVVVSTPNELNNECGGTVSAVDGATTVSLSGDTIERGTVCVISLNVTATWAGEKQNSVTVNSSAGTGNTSTASLSVLPPPLRNRAYFTSYTANTISYVNLDGSGGGDLSTGNATVSHPSGVAIDLSKGRIYWANSGANTISYANLDGSGGADLYTSGVPLNEPTTLAIDPATFRIYWANAGGTGSYANTIAFAYLDGSGGGGTLSTGFAHVSTPNGVALDPAAGEIYWANAFGGAYISKASLANDNTGNDVSLSPGVPTGAGLDPNTGTIYWGDQGTEKLYYTTTLFTPTQFGTGTASHVAPRGVAIDPAAGRLYWGNQIASAISYANLNGSGVGESGDISTVSTGNSYPALLEAPVAAGAPAIAGGSAPGSALSCSSGSWAPDLLVSHLYRAPQSFAYQWTLDGADIGGATSSTYTASSPGSYGCTVTARNFVGSAQQTSAPLTVQAPSTPSPGVPAGPTGGPTGERAAALAMCKKRFRGALRRERARDTLTPPVKQRLKRRFRKCERRTSLLPV